MSVRFLALGQVRDRQKPEISVNAADVDFADTFLSFIGLRGPPEPNGKSPESRLTSAKDARRLLGEMVLEDNASRALERALVKGCIDGNPPYDDQRRRTEGRGWECNLNFMEGTAIMNRTAVPYYNLFARVDYFAECRTAYQPDHPDHEQWSQAISLRFHNMLKRWREFNWNVQQASYWMRLHGIGFAFPDRDDDWRFRSLETGSVFVPKGSPSVLDNRIPFVVIRVPYRILELWERIKDEKAATDAGWNVEATRNAIKYGMKGMLGAGMTDWYSQPWEKFERLLKNGDLVASFTDGDIVNCAIILVQEWAKPGQAPKISKFIFTEFQVAGEQDIKAMPTREKDNQDFLFADPNCYDSYLEALIPFFRNTGDGTWHSVRGYAMEAFKHLEVDNRLLCQAINREFLNSSLILQFPNERGRQQSQLQVWGTVVKLPVGGEFKQIAVQGGTDGVVLMHRVLESHLGNNLGVFQPRSMSREDGKGEQPTARQVDYQASSEASIGEGEITIWYEQLDSLYQTMYSRASDPSTSDEEAKRFQKECLDDGVPKEALADMEFVRANRQNGYGSPEMGIMKFNQSKDLVPMLPEDGKQNWLEDAVTNIHGPEKTKRYAPRLHLPNDQDWMADVENQMIANGRLPELTAGQDDVIHLQHHFQDAQQTLGPTAQQMQQSGPNGQQDPQAVQQASSYADLMAQHIEQHLARLQRDPTRRKEAKLFEDQFKQLGEFSVELHRALRRSHRQQQIQLEQRQTATALSALDQAKIQSVQAGTAIAAEKARSTIENQRLKTFNTIQLKNVKTAHDMGIERATTKQDMALERAKARANGSSPIPSDVFSGPAPPGTPLAQPIDNPSSIPASSTTL